MPTIASATAADATPILALQRRAYESEARLYNDWAIPPLTQSLESLLGEIRSTTVLKATEAEVIVGSVRASLSDERCLIGRLIVEPALQGRGIGSALLQAIERAFPQATLFELFTGSKSESNIRFYRRHGYAITGTRRLSERVTFVVMSKHAKTDEYQRTTASRARVPSGGTMLGYCGINCDECPAYKGTVTSDIGLLEKVAGSAWEGLNSAADWACLGCTPADQGFIAKDCAACKIRACAIAKGVQNCAACSDYESCGLLHDFMEGDSEPRCNEPETVRRRMEWLRGRYLAYEKEQVARADAER